MSLFMNGVSAEGNSFETDERDMRKYFFFRWTTKLFIRIKLELKDEQKAPVPDSYILTQNGVFFRCPSLSM